MLHGTLGSINSNLSCVWSTCLIGLYSESLVPNSQATPNRTGLQLRTPLRLAETLPFPTPSFLPAPPLRIMLLFSSQLPTMESESRCHMSIKEPLFLPSFTETDQGSQLTLGAQSHLPPAALGSEPRLEPQQSGWGAHFLLAAAGPISRAGPWMPCHITNTSVCFTISGPRTYRTSAAFTDSSNQIRFGHWHLHETNRTLLPATLLPSTRYYQAVMPSNQQNATCTSQSVYFQPVNCKCFSSKCSSFLSVTIQNAIL